MNHFFVLYSPQQGFAAEKQRVLEYFQGMSQVENFSFTESPFSASVFRHQAWPSLALSSCQRNHLTFIGSARLDNWDELKQELANENFTQESALILALVDKYGEEAFEKLIGDFSFVIWDANKQQLYSVKDPIGSRPLFYYQHADMCIIASSVSAIRAFVGIEHLSIHEKFVARELLNYPAEVEETFFNEIHRLKPAHMGIIQPGATAFRIKKYWTFKQIDTSQFSTEKQVYDELRRLFQQAIETRLRGVKRAATQLSGGLDSSAITVLASRMMPKENLFTYSFVLNEKTRAYSELGIDEQNTQRSIIDYAGLREENHHHSDDVHYPNTFAMHDTADQVMGGFANSDTIWQDSMYKQAGTHGVELIFSGFPGDEGISNTGSEYFFEYFHAFDLTWMLTQAFSHPYPFLKLCYRYLSKRFINSYKRKYNQIQKSRNLLAPQSIYHTQLKDTSFSFSSSFRQGLIDKVFRSHTCLRTESENLYAVQYGIVMAYPLADLRFVQFALSLPVEYFNPKPFTRPLFRKICEGILPDDVRLQKKYNGAMTLAFAEYWIKKQIEDYKNRPLKNSLGLIDTEKIWDESDLDQAIRQATRDKMDYLIEKNLPTLGK